MSLLNGEPMGRSRRMRLAAFTAVAAATTLVLAACGGSSSGSAQTGAATGGTGPIKLYGVAGQTGFAAAVAPSLLSGLQAAAATINANGGVLGRQIEVQIENDESNPTKAVSLVQTKLRSEKPDLVFGGTSSGEILPVSQVTNAAKVFTVSVGADSALGDAAKLPYTFAVDPTQSSQTNSMLAEIKGKGFKRVGFISSSDASGVGYAKAYKQAIQDAGLELTGAEVYDTSAVDMTSQLERLKSTNPDALIFQGTTAGAYLMKSREKAGLLDMPTYADATVQSTDWVKAVTPDQHKNVLTQVYRTNVSSSKGAGIDALNATLQKQGVKSTLPLHVYALSSDMLLSWANAAISVNSIDPDKVREALESDKYERKFPTAIANSYGWTATTHLSESSETFIVIPATSITDGRYVLG